MEKREHWNNRLSFILAAVGSAVGLGNAWRFPGLCAKFGGGAFLIAYIICMLIVGIPLLMMELAIGRKTNGSAPKAMRNINRKAEKLGWAATTNAFVILSYYIVVFAWCILMCFVTYKFATSHSTPELASNLWAEEIGTTWYTSFLDEGGQIKFTVLLSLFIAWLLVYFSIIKGPKGVGKVAQFTVTIPIIMLLILAVKGFINNPYLGEALKTLFVPKFSSFADPLLWINALGQAFYSLSIMMAIMFAYGSYLKKSSNIASDTLIIAFSDLLISVLASIVLFTTLYSTGKTIEDMSVSGIATAFIIYPEAIVMLTNAPVANAIFGFIFYFMLCTLAIDSAFSILEGVAAAISDKFKLDKKKTIFGCAFASGLVSLVFTTGAGVAWLDIVDNWTQYTLIIIGILETVVVGWFFRPKEILNEINKNTKKLKMPRYYFEISVKYISPVLLFAFIVWQFVALGRSGFRYNEEYQLHAEIIGGWVILALVIASGFIIDLIFKKCKRFKKLVEEENKEITWSEEINISERSIKN